MHSAPARFRDIPSALLLALSLAVASQRLVLTDWTSDLWLAFLLAMAGACLGFALGLSRFSGWPAGLMAVLYTLVLVPFVAAAALYPAIPWLERMLSMGGRAGHSLTVLFSAAPLEDAFLIFIFFLLAFWLIGIASLYALARKGGFGLAILPGGLALVLLQLFDSGGDRGVLFVALYLFLALLLLGRINYARHSETWKARRVLSSSETRANMNLTIAGLAFVLVLTAWALPVTPRTVPLLRSAWLDLTTLWEKNESLSNVIAGLDTENSAVPVNEFYGRNLALGQDAALSDQVYFRIQTIGIGDQDRYYWRVRSYDTYAGGAWTSSLASEQVFTARTRSLALPDVDGVNAEFTFKVMETTAGSLVTPARPVWVSRPSLLTYLPVSDEVVDPLLFHANQPLRPGEEYIVHAVLMEPTVKQLRAAGTQYPAWVSERYLQLPPDFPPAITDLAQTITAQAATPYDQATAITAYLRREIAYTIHVPVAPAGRDTLAWFLFDYQQGYCNYYATAEVVMLRALGVPARLVVGFGESEYSSPGWYTVRQNDAHAWPEVYFPGIGWVEFEPTSAEPELLRPSGEEAAPSQATSQPSIPLGELTPQLPAEDEGAATGSEPNPTAGRAPSSLVMLMIFFIGTILLGGGIAWAYISGVFERGAQAWQATFNAPWPILASRWFEQNALPIPTWLARRAWHSGLSPLGRDFMIVYHGLRWLKVAAGASLTPAEAAAALLSRLPQAHAEIALLLQTYQAEAYGPAPHILKETHLAALVLRRMALARRRSERWHDIISSKARPSLKRRKD